MKIIFIFLVIFLEITIFGNHVLASPTSSAPNKSKMTSRHKRQRSFDLNEEPMPEEIQTVSTSHINNDDDERSTTSKPQKKLKQVILSHSTEKDQCDHTKTCLHWTQLTSKEKRVAYDRRRYYTLTQQNIVRRKALRRAAFKRLPEQDKRQIYDKFNASRRARKLEMTEEQRIEAKRKEKERSQRRRDAKKLLLAGQNAQQQ